MASKTENNETYRILVFGNKENASALKIQLPIFKLPESVKRFDGKYVENFAILTPKDLISLEIEPFSKVEICIGKIRAVFSAVPCDLMKLGHVALCDKAISKHYKNLEKMEVATISKVTHTQPKSVIYLDVPEGLDPFLAKIIFYREYVQKCKQGLAIPLKQSSVLLMTDFQNHNYDLRYSFCNIADRTKEVRVEIKSPKVSAKCDLPDLNSAIYSSPDLKISKMSVKSDSTDMKSPKNGSTNIKSPKVSAKYYSPGIKPLKAIEKYDSSERNISEIADAFQELNISQNNAPKCFQNVLVETTQIEKVFTNSLKTSLASAKAQNGCTKETQKSSVSPKTTICSPKSLNSSSTISNTSMKLSETPTSTKKSKKKKRGIEKPVEEFYCIPTPDCEVRILGESSPQNLEKSINSDQKYFKTEHYYRFKNLIERKLKSDNFILSPWTGLLITGQPGVGKRFMIETLASELYLKLYVVQLSHFSESDSRVSVIKDTFNTAMNGNSESIILMDSIDCINANEWQFRKVLSNFMRNIKDLSKRIIVLAKTNEIDLVDEKLRQSSLFDREFIVPPPDCKTRCDIFMCRLEALSHRATRSEVEEILKDAAGFSASDLDFALRLAWKSAVQRRKKDQASGMRSELQLEYSDLLYGVNGVVPYFLRKNYTTVSKVHWNEIYGYQKVKEKIQKLTCDSDENRVKGILLYGPPGCSKTMLVRAVATEKKVTFFSVKCSDLLSKYVGETEKSLCSLFDKAIASSPSLIFIDELESLCGDRTTSGNSVVPELLSLLRSSTERGNLLIMGATNRPHEIDSSLLTPGCFESLIHVDLPDCESRCEIWREILKNIPTSEKEAKNLIPTSESEIKHDFSSNSKRISCFPPKTEKCSYSPPLKSEKFSDISPFPQKSEINIKKLCEKTDKFSCAEICGVYQSAASSLLNELYNGKNKTNKYDDDRNYSNSSKSPNKSSKTNISNSNESDILNMIDDNDKNCEIKRDILNIIDNDKNYEDKSDTLNIIDDNNKNYQNKSDILNVIYDDKNIGGSSNINDDNDRNISGSSNINDDNDKNNENTRDSLNIDENKSDTSNINDDNDKNYQSQSDILNINDNGKNYQNESDILNVNDNNENKSGFFNKNSDNYKKKSDSLNKNRDNKLKIDKTFITEELLLEHIAMTCPRTSDSQLKLIENFKQSFKSCV